MMKSEKLKSEIKQINFGLDEILKAAEKMRNVNENDEIEEIVFPRLHISKIENEFL